MNSFPVRICAVVLFSLSVSYAASADLQTGLTLSAAGVRNDDENAVGEEYEDVFTVQFDDAAGAGVAVMVPLSSRFGLELAAFRFEPEAQFTFLRSRSLGPVPMFPMTASLIVEIPIGRSFAAEVGAGAAYVSFDEFDDDEGGPEELELTDEWTWTATAALRVDLARRLSLVAGAKYLPVEPEFTAIDREPLPLDTSFMIASAGVRLRF